MNDLLKNAIFLHGIMAFIFFSINSSRDRRLHTELKARLRLTHTDTNKSMSSVGAHWVMMAGREYAMEGSLVRS